MVILIGKKMGVTSLGRHIRPACHQALLSRFVIKTMWKMWIKLLCACVLYPMGSRGFSWPYMGIVTSIGSHGLYARFWLVEKIFAALWLVTPQRGQYYYFRFIFELPFSHSKTANIARSTIRVMFGVGRRRCSFRGERLHGSKLGYFL